MLLVNFILLPFKVDLWTTWELVMCQILDLTHLDIRNKRNYFFLLQIVFLKLSNRFFKITSEKDLR